MVAALLGGRRQDCVVYSLALLLRTIEVDDCCGVGRTTR
jgi:hypothetical protein